MTQNEGILNYLKSHIDGITPQDALSEFGCMRLSGRIHDLRADGNNIITQNETKRNRFGKKVTYARYILVNGDKADN